MCGYKNSLLSAYADIFGRMLTWWHPVVEAYERHLAINMDIYIQIKKKYIWFEAKSWKDHQSDKRLSSLGFEYLHKNPFCRVALNVFQLDRCSSLTDTAIHAKRG